MFIQFTWGPWWGVRGIYEVIMVCPLQVTRLDYLGYILALTFCFSPLILPFFFFFLLGYRIIFAHILLHATLPNNNTFLLLTEARSDTSIPGNCPPGHGLCDSSMECPGISRSSLFRRLQHGPLSDPAFTRCTGGCEWKACCRVLVWSSRWCCCFIRMLMSLLFSEKVWSWSLLLV